MVIAIPKEVLPGENRVSIVPDVASKLIKKGVSIDVESNAGINAGFTDIPRNEAFCMELAQRSGFSIPNSKIMKLGDHELFVVDRYDRL